ncbi:MAG: serine/threonine protein kinase, partial [Planctomycetaceae bacterium]|nr:serine/threonine protein kinase [Planctomycetaceae bacterium]
MRCRDIDLHVLMADDEDSVEVRSMAGHVETCVQCQRRLLEVAGDHELLTEVRETLQAIDETLPYSSDPASSSIILCIEGSSTDDFGAECEPVALDFLSPPGHPEMLGRIGRYEVERVIGSGGMGVVLKGFDSELHRVVAIKVLKPHLAHNGAARRRFAREAQSAAAVVHEHVIPIHDVLTDSDTPYLVMQYVPGQSLQARVDERGPLEAKEVLRIARQVAAGLAAAHAQGVVHRDVKPANILLEDSVDRVLISDFGLARTVDDATLTRTGVVAGTPHYMSPEQAKGDLVDHRSDLFSLGSCIYFMCTGRPPFRAEHALAILNRICNDQHRPVEEINADVPPELADLIDRLLSKDRTERFRDAVQAEHQIETVLSDIQQGRRSKRLRWTRRWPRWRKRFRRGVIISMVLTAWMWTSAGFWPVEQQPKGDQPGDLLARNEIAAESP